ncbi:MAG: prolyl oligopeptidase family serine peptidase [Gammaproteobacteria bacterium]
MRYLSTVFLSLLATAAAAATQTPAAATLSPSTPLALTKIMSDPDWIAMTPEDPYWGADGKTVYYAIQPHDSPIATPYAVDLGSAKAHRLADADIAASGSPDHDYNRDLTREAYVVAGNLYVKNLATGTVTQLTRGIGPVSQPRFMTDGHSVSYVTADDEYRVSDLDTGLTRRAAVIKTKAPPDATANSYQYYSAEQLRLFEALQKDKTDAAAARTHAQALAKASGNAGAEPFYVGADVKVVQRSLSPDGDWMLLVTESRHYDAGPHGSMPNYVTPSGRIAMTDVHRRVGWNDPAPQQAMLLDLAHHKQYPLDLTQLPGIEDDPLAKLRKSAVEWDVKHGISREQAEASVKAPKVRPVQIWGAAWSDDGTRLALQFRSIDNKDRWIATVDFAHGMKLVTRNRLTDPAWINWDYNDIGWLHDNHSLWYLSEASGYSELYVDDVGGGGTRRLTSGHFEVSHPVASRDDRYIYYRANKTDPGIYELYRADVANGKSDQLTHLGGMNGMQPSMDSDTNFLLSPRGDEILFYHSSMLRPPELYAISTTPGTRAERLTHTIKPAFSHYGWIVPKIVNIPSAHFKGTLRARLYLPADYDPHKSYAGVAFIHGAGYLQDAHQGWSYYFHEMMFNNFLAQHGYVVVDVDYRGSKGYGRDWRTDIYQHMGHPEVDDITDAMHWLEQKYNVDSARLGVYGGSYGGFMTYMMMFRAPGLFQAGAALRPVADWANYNDLYSSDILNRPAIDPEAYEISSPIHFAQNLKGELLIEQGIEDDNVFFQDTVHMTQKLIELENPHFQVAFFPLEHHGFEAPDAWLDEYRRVWKLFCTNVSPRKNCQTDR